MAKFKAKGMVDGKEIEVELDDSTVMTREAHEAQLETTVEKRLARQRNALAKDEEFVAGILKDKGFDPSKKAPDASEAVERALKELREREVAPLVMKLSEADKRASRIQTRTLVAELTRELAAKGVPPNVAPRIAALEASRFAFEDKTESFAMKEGEDFVFSTKATKDQPFKGIAEFAEEWASKKENAPFIVPSGQKGPGITGEKTTASAIAKRSELATVEAKTKFIGEHGLEAFQNLPA